MDLDTVFLDRAFVVSCFYIIVSLFKQKDRPRWPSAGSYGSVVLRRWLEVIGLMALFLCGNGRNFDLRVLNPDILFLSSVMLSILFQPEAHGVHNAGSDVTLISTPRFPVLSSFLLFLSYKMPAYLSWFFFLLTFDWGGLVVSWCFHV